MKQLMVTIFVVLLIVPAGLFGQDRIEIAVQPGFNLISSNIHLPDEFWAGQAGPDVRRIFAQFGAEANGNPMSLLVAEDGRFYVPNRRFNNIPCWEEAAGYAALMNEERVIVWDGERIPANTDVPIGHGWNYIAYYPTYQLDASAPDFRVLSPVIEQIDCAIDQNGGFILPEWEFSSMAPWREGRGYMVRATEDVVLQYPEEAGEGEELWQPLVGDHWVRAPGRYVMPLLINEIRGGDAADGDMIAAYKEDLLVGYGTVQDLRCGVPLWGDEPNSEGIDGLRAGEDFRLVYWIAGQDREVEVEIVEVLAGDPIFSNFNMTVLVISADIGERAQRQILHFNQGWNLISLNVSPAQEFWQREEGPDVRALFRNQWFQDQRWIHPYLMKDERGTFWMPSREWCMIPYLNLSEGYLVLVADDNDVAVTGEPIPPNRDIPISTGWNLVSYFPEYQLEASSPDFYAISPIVDHVIIAKNMQGQFMLPQRRFSNMAPWQSGNGYQIKVDTDVVLNYPSEQIQGAAIEARTHGTHWSFEPSGYQNMSLLVPEIANVKLESGDQIAAFDAKGVLVGVGDANNGVCGLALWGRMNNSEPGLAEGESFELRLWRESSNVESPLELTENLVYHTDGFAIASAQVTAELPSEVTLIGCFPNPFNGTTRISFDHKEPGEVTLAAFNLSGQEVSRLHQGWTTAGHHESTWQTVDLPTGIYVIRIEASGKVQSMKAMLIK